MAIPLFSFSAQMEPRKYVRKLGSFIKKVLVEAFLINSFHFCFCSQSHFIFYYFLNKFFTIYVKYRRFQCAINLMNWRNTSIERLSNERLTESSLSSDFYTFIYIYHCKFYSKFVVIGKNKFISIYRSIL